MKKKTAKTAMIVAMLFAVSLYFIGGTYARYASTFTGNAETEIAKWNVSLKNGSDTFSATKNLKLIKAADDYVVANKIAPDATVSGNLNLDLSGTEVAVKVSVTVEEAGLKSKLSALGVTASDITATIELAGANESSATVEGTAANGYTIKLPGKAAFTSTNGQYTITVKVTWTNNEHDEGDTNAGTNASQPIEIPVTVKVEQLTARG